MIKKLTDAEKAQMHDQLWRTIAKDQETKTEQAALIAQLSDELAAMTKTLDKAGDMLELMTKTASANREAYEAETQSTMEMAGRITQLEGEVAEWSRRALEEQRRWAAASSDLADAAKIVTRLLRYADKTAERHPQAVTIPGQSARADAGIWLAQFNRQNKELVHE